MSVSQIQPSIIQIPHTSHIILFSANILSCILYLYSPCNGESESMQYLKKKGEYEQIFLYLPTPSLCIIYSKEKPLPTAFELTLFSDTDTIPSAASLYQQNHNTQRLTQRIQHALESIKLNIFSFLFYFIFNFLLIPLTPSIFFILPLPSCSKSQSGSLRLVLLLCFQPSTPFIDLCPKREKRVIFYSEYCLLACWKSFIFLFFLDLCYAL